MKSINLLFRLLAGVMLVIILSGCGENEFESYVGNQKVDNQINAVFIGNSITANWYKLHSSFFTDNNYINKGIGGETTTDFLARFNGIITDTNPKCVVIMGGINDITTNNGNSYNEEKTFGNIKTMAEIAKGKDIIVILCSVLPMIYDGRHPDTKDRIIALNALVKLYAEQNNCIYVDYYSYVVDKNGALMLPYTYDKLHLTEDGYLVMEPIIKKVIDDIVK